MLVDRQVLFQGPVKTAPGSHSSGNPAGWHCLMFSENGEPRTLFSLRTRASQFWITALKIVSRYLIQHFCVLEGVGSKLRVVAKQIN